MEFVKLKNSSALNLSSTRIFSLFISQLFLFLLLFIVHFLFNVQAAGCSLPRYSNLIELQYISFLLIGFFHFPCIIIILNALFISSYSHTNLKTIVSG